jgi:ubiquinol-cytochrome c reductase cytochrome b/c1 subunit
LIMHPFRRILLTTVFVLAGPNVFAQTAGQPGTPQQTPGGVQPGQGQVETAPPPVTGPAVPSPVPVQAPSSLAPAPSTEALPPRSVNWSFTGPFGVYDRASLQRGFQIYKEVCSACHALSHVAFRNLADPGGPEFSQDEVKAIAAGYKIPAGPNAQGQTVDANGMPLTRAGTAADYFPSPFANEQAARTANNGALPPDLSLIVKAREGNQNYVYSILTGFGQKPPANETIANGLYYNPYFPRHQIAMPPPLMNATVTFADGTPNTLDQEAHDIVTFLAWASEPTMDERKQTGFVVMLYLIGFTVLLFLSYRRIWHGHHDLGAVGEGKGSETRLAP